MLTEGKWMITAKEPIRIPQLIFKMKETRETGAIKNSRFMLILKKTLIITETEHRVQTSKF